MPKDSLEALVDYAAQAGASAVMQGLVQWFEKNPDAVLDEATCRGLLAVITAQKDQFEAALEEVTSD